MSMKPSEVHYTEIVVKEFTDREGSVDYEKAYESLCYSFDKSKAENAEIKQRLSSIRWLVEDLIHVRDSHNGEVGTKWFKNVVTELEKLTSDG